jgi:hypothetical protein
MEVTSMIGSLVGSEVAIIVEVGSSVVELSVSVGVRMVGSLLLSSDA